MDWARDQLGRLVQASGGGLFSYGLKCPTCGEPVFRRLGSQRRPHFAHYGHGAKPGCELYWPSSSATAQSPVVRKEKGGARAVVRRGGVFLSQRGDGGFQLTLRLPRIESAAGVSGEIQIRTGTGVRCILPENLRATQLVPLSPALPLANIVGFEMLEAVAEAIRDDVSQFRETGNFFCWSEDGGRLITRLEPLELGGRYRLLSRRAVSFTHLTFDIREIYRGKMSDWYLWEVELPNGDSRSSNELAESIARQLGRIVRAPTAKIWPIDPPPHHIEVDGTLVFPSGTASLSVRRTECCEAVISTNGGAEGSPRLTWFDENWGEISCIGSGEHSLMRGDQVLWCFRVGPCDLYSPCGIQLDTGQYRWELIDTANVRVALESAVTKLQLVCPSERVAAMVLVDSSLWDRSGAVLTNTGTDGFGRVDAGGFGVLEDKRAPKVAVTQVAVNPKQVWIEGIVASLGGPRLASKLSWRSSFEPHASFEMSTCYRLSWIATHVKAAGGG